MYQGAKLQTFARCTLVRSRNTQELKHLRWPESCVLDLQLPSTVTGKRISRELNMKQHRIYGAIILALAMASTARAQQTPVLRASISTPAPMISAPEPALAA